MFFLQIIPALPGTLAVYGDHNDEGFTNAVIGWGLVQLDGGLQYVAPLVCDAVNGRVHDARDDSNFLRVTAEDYLTTPAEFRRWETLNDATPLADRCKCGSWDAEICALKSNQWQETDTLCACDCHARSATPGAG